MSDSIEEKKVGQLQSNETIAQIPCPCGFTTKRDLIDGFNSSLTKIDETKLFWLSQRPRNDRITQRASELQTRSSGNRFLTRRQPAAAMSTWQAGLWNQIMILKWQRNSYAESRRVHLNGTIGSCSIDDGLSESTECVEKSKRKLESEPPNFTVRKLLWSLNWDRFLQNTFEYVLRIGFQVWNGSLAQRAPVLRMIHFLRVKLLSDRPWLVPIKIDASHDCTGTLRKRRFLCNRHPSWISSILTLFADLEAAGCHHRSCRALHLEDADAARKEPKST